MRTTFLLAALLCACVRLDPVEPNPNTPPPDDAVVIVVPDVEHVPVHVPDDPTQEPEGTPCDRSCARRAFMRCEPIERCEESCQAHEGLGKAFSWMPLCGERATSCEAWDACATGAR